MSKKDYKGVHHNFGGLLMGLGTATAVAGPVNTYLRSGTLRLFAVVLQILTAHSSCHFATEHTDKHYV